MPETEHQSKTDFAGWHDIAERIVDTVDRSSAARRCKVIGISGSQGSGKSTLAKIVVEHLQRADVQAVSVSLDDFYLSRSERNALAKKIHPLLKTRGVPGTHDTNWLQNTLKTVQSARSRELVSFALPIFDKASDDRCGERNAACEVLVLEGWCLGVQAQATLSLAEPINELERIEDAQGIWRSWVNEQTPLSYQPLWNEIDYWVQLRPPSFAQVEQWRSQQEQQIAPDRRMSPEVLRRFIDHYERLTKWQWECAPWRPGLLVELAEDHRVASVDTLLED